MIAMNALVFDVGGVIGRHEEHMPQSGNKYSILLSRQTCWLDFAVELYEEFGCGLQRNRR
ncbi:hypothetical protein AAY81_08560 [Denitrobacterium detoxificans]|nr:hypothetical protein AAY81_08560 [Denitrobacterium detoxificans]